MASACPGLCGAETVWAPGVSMGVSRLRINSLTTSGVCVYTRVCIYITTYAGGAFWDLNH